MINFTPIDIKAIQNPKSSDKAELTPAALKVALPKLMAQRIGPTGNEVPFCDIALYAEKDGNHTPCTTLNLHKELPEKYQKYAHLLLAGLYLGIMNGQLKPADKSNHRIVLTDATMQNLINNAASRELLSSLAKSNGQSTQPQRIGNAGSHAAEVKSNPGVETLRERQTYYYLKITPVRV